MLSQEGDSPGSPFSTLHMGGLWELSPSGAGIVWVLWWYLRVLIVLWAQCELCVHGLTFRGLYILSLCICRGVEVFWEGDKATSHL